VLAFGPQRLEHHRYRHEQGGYGCRQEQQRAAPHTEDAASPGGGSGGPAEPFELVDQCVDVGTPPPIGDFEPRWVHCSPLFCSPSRPQRVFPQRWVYGRGVQERQPMRRAR
jgi:hypothetical protein